MPQVQNQNLSADYVNLGGAKIYIQGNHHINLRISATTPSLLSASCRWRGFLLHQLNFKHYEEKNL